MATIIRKEARPCGTARSRYKARRTALVAERRKYEALERKIAAAISGCSRNVAKAVTTASDWRISPGADVSMENPAYRKVCNEAGRQIHVTQKQCRQSVPAYYD